MKIIIRERKIYAITQRGVTMFKKFIELKTVLHIVEKTGNKVTKDPICSKAHCLASILISSRWVLLPPYHRTNREPFKLLLADYEACLNKRL